MAAMAPSADKGNHCGLLLDSEGEDELDGVGAEVELGVDVKLGVGVGVNVEEVVGVDVGFEEGVGSSEGTTV
jgi:hypothetical protein